jgi:hypothetical protein
MADSKALERRVDLMLPPPPRPPKRKEVVLDEDDWTQKLEGIIERDFFPELGKLQSKVEWLEVRPVFCPLEHLQDIAV